MADNTTYRLVSSQAQGQYHKPTVCSKCGGTMIFRGVGEYRCDRCGYIQYDDYGKVRNYLEQHRGANAAEVEDKTGVEQRSIHTMLREGRIEVTENSRVSLRCEMCRKKIRSGRFCPECEKLYEQKQHMDSQKRASESFQGFGLDRDPNATGAKRFKHKYQ